VANILRENGIEPAPVRKRETSWKTFIKAHFDVLAAIDFTTLEVWTQKGLVTFYLLFTMHLSTRRVHFAGCTPNPDERWMKQIARNLTDAEDGFLDGKRYMLMDRDTKFCVSFQAILEDGEVESVLLPPRSPNLNAQIERFFGSLKSECLNRMIFFGESSLRNAVREFIAHYHAERNHQSFQNSIIEPDAEVGTKAGSVECRERLGGMLNYYFRKAG
jgi:transposase InsO family protein